MFLKSGPGAPPPPHRNLPSRWPWRRKATTARKVLTLLCLETVKSDLVTACVEMNHRESWMVVYRQRCRQAIKALGFSSLETGGWQASRRWLPPTALKHRHTLLPRKSQ